MLPHRSPQTSPLPPSLAHSDFFLFEDLRVRAPEGSLCLKGPRVYRGLIESIHLQQRP